MSEAQGAQGSLGGVAILEPDGPGVNYSETWPIVFPKTTGLLPLVFPKPVMSSAIRAWSVATSVGIVEALKDQGICRWNHAFRSAQQRLKTHVGSSSQAKKLSSSSSSSSSAMISTTLKPEKPKQSEESLRTVMYLSCWGPN
ncbi:unnamed protein product [Sphenostylis stenocarpa]|uniref:Uncharacterized protein n=1 Tax=Sphenostylis stenocarpa TaxID=92480 RepID=A0AA86W5H0_9FABA|nr:unnamed protein product [Sphenostylis stenocarpa]